jgi:hypothetical protein
LWWSAGSLFIYIEVIAATTGTYNLEKAKSEAERTKNDAITLGVEARAKSHVLGM